MVATITLSHRTIQGWLLQGLLFYSVVMAGCGEHRPMLLLLMWGGGVSIPNDTILGMCLQELLLASLRPIYIHDHLLKNIN